MKVKEKIIWEKVILSVLLVVLIGMCAVLIVNLLTFRRTYNGSYRLLISERLHHGPLTATDVNLIRSWMTFDYINHIFGLPSSYLQSSMHISESAYPNLTVSSYAKAEDIPATAALDELVAAVRSHFNNQ